MKKNISYHLLLICLAVFVSFSSKCQYSKYLIKFSNKANSPFTLDKPAAYLSTTALERRKKNNIPIDSLDLPINPTYLETIKTFENVRLLSQSKWLNQIAIETSDPFTISQIELLPFVESSKPIAARNAIKELTKVDELPVNKQAARPLGDTKNTLDYGLSETQIHLHNGEFLHNHGLKGEGMLITLLDGGFKNYDVLPTFDSARKNNQIKGTWDFVSGDSSVLQDDAHGTWCFSTIAANMPGKFIGAAPYASYYLFRTEDINTEYPIEEQYMAAAIEKADSLGVNVCSISLGYSTFNDPSFDYSYEDMNGKTSICARAVNIAAKKGMLLVVAAGNDGNKPWKFITSPADAEGALTVGAVDTFGKVPGFSAYGPSFDGRIKPTVAAVGASAVVANATTGMPFYGNGTSFACPNMAGLATCLWQAFPEANSKGLMDALQQSASIFNNPDDRMGYGIPDMKKAFVILQKKFHQKINYLSLCKYELLVDLIADSTVMVELERKLAGEPDYKKINSKQIKNKLDNIRYHFSDDLTGISSNSLSYRIKVNIGTDTAFYLDSYTIPFDSRCTTILPLFDKIAISPNPSNDKINITIERLSESQITVELFNNIGQKIHSESYKQLPGTFTKPLNLKSYQSGIYFLRILEGNKIIMNKEFLKL